MASGVNPKSCILESGSTWRIARETRSARMNRAINKNSTLCKYTGMTPYTAKRTMRALLVFALLLTGCKRPEVSGQVFITSVAGINFPLGGIEVFVIDAAEYRNYADARREEVATKRQVLEKRYRDELTTFQSATNAEQLARAVLKNTIESKAYTNNPAYLPLITELAKNAKLDEQYRAMERKQVEQYGSIKYADRRNTARSGRPKFDNANNQPPTPSYSDARDSIRSRRIIIDGTIAGIQIKLEKPLEQVVDDASIKSFQAKSRMAVAKQELDEFPSVLQWFEGFNPKTVVSVVSDSAGNFKLPAMGSRYLLYAKASRSVGDSPEHYFWLVPPPAKDQKLILSNQNMFCEVVSP